MAEQNYKGQLIHHCDLSGLSFRFEVSATGPSHDPSFTSYVFVNDERRGEGQAKTKKAAVNLACKMALLSLQNQNQENHEAAQPVGNVAAPGNPVVSSPRDVVSPSQVNGAAGNVLLDANYIGLFNDFCQRNKLNSSFVDVRRGPPHLPEFFCSAVICESQFPEARGKNKKEARQNAVHLALKELKPQYPGDLQLQQIPGLDDVEEAEESNSQSESSEDSSSSSAQRMENEPSQSASSDSQAQPVGNVAAPGNSVVSSPRDVVSPSQVNGAAGNVLLDANYIGLFNEFCQRNKCLDSSFVDARRGLPHLPDVNNLLDEFDSITKLGEGGFGQVFKARKILDNKFYAVKIVEYREEKVRQEATVLANLDYHQNIVRYYNTRLGLHTFSDSSKSSSSSSDFSKPVRCIYIQMELCENGSLKNWIEKRNLQSEVNKSKSLEIFRQIIEGVRYIHAQKLIHRDLKPENIFFTKGMTVKIGDFGLVTPMTGEEKSKALERTRGTGTPSYMAPEQNNNKYENEVDIYALGLILFELLWIFQSGHERAKVLTNVRKCEFPSGFEQRHPLEKHEISKMLSHDPKKRPLAENLSVSFQKGKALDSQTR